MASKDGNNNPENLDPKIYGVSPQKKPNLDADTYKIIENEDDIYCGELIKHIITSIINASNELKLLTAPNPLKEFLNKKIDSELHKTVENDLQDGAIEVNELFINFNVENLSEELKEERYVYLVKKAEKILNEKFSIIKTLNQKTISSLSNIEKALTLLEEAGKYCPDKHEWIYLSGIIYSKLNYINEAKRLFQEAISLGSNLAYFSYGHILKEDEELERAYEMFKNFAEYDTGFAALVSLADTCFKLEKYEEALEYYKKSRDDGDFSSYVLGKIDEIEEILGKKD